MKLEEDELKILRSLLGRIDNSDLADLLGMDRFGGVVGTAADRAEPYKPPESWTLRELIHQYKDYRDPLVEGLLRRGEIMNLISAAKRGKTWLIMDLAISVASGNPWLGFPVRQGSVLVLDNELHPETISQRGKKIVEERQFQLDAFGDNIHYLIMRGCLRDVDLICQDIMNFRHPVSLIIIDALYRTYPAKTDENDNGTMAVLYNKLDRAILKLNAAMVLVHHASKGNQSTKFVTDVGAGAGAFSRATDTHMILRPHREDDAVVVEAVPRTFAQPTARCLRYNYPLWIEAPDLDPKDLAGLRPERGKSQANGAPQNGQDTMSPSEFAKLCVTQAEEPWQKIHDRAGSLGFIFGPRKIQDLLRSAEALGVVIETRGNKNQKLYSLNVLFRQDAPPEEESTIVQ